MKTQKAFTLIELLVVIAIVGLLSAIIVVSLQGQKKSAEQTKSLQFSTTMSHVLKAYAIGVWSFDNDSGTIVNDFSGNGNNANWFNSSGGSVSGSYTKGAVNQAALFDGTKYIKVLQSDKLNSKSGAITVEFWAYWDSLTGTTYPVLNYKVSAGLISYYCYNSSSTLGCYMYDNKVPAAGMASFSLSGVLKSKYWTHVALTYDGKGKARLFFNSKEYSPNPGFNMTSSIRDSQDLYIGGYDFGGRMTGMVDEVRVYDSYITLSEVQKHYAEGLLKRGLAEK